MVKAIFDTNIAIDVLNRVPQARKELRQYDVTAVSIVTWIEVMMGAPPNVAGATKAVLQRYDLIDLDGEVAERAVEIRRKHRMKLPDAIIWASAQRHGLLLVTRNTKDFPAGDPGVRHPYTI